MLHIETFQCNPFQELCYVVWDEATQRCLIIDPGMCCDAEWHRVHAFITSHQLTPDFVLLTHNHVDHVMGSAYLVHTYGIEILGSVEDQDHLPSVQVQNMAFGVEAELHWLPITRNVTEGDRLDFAGHRIEVIDCPGHSHHGLCYYFPDDGVLFSGDVLFYCSLGRSDFGTAMGGNGPLLVQSIRQKLLTLPPQTRVCPGHGPTTTIGSEAQYNPYI